MTEINWKDVNEISRVIKIPVVGKKYRLQKRYLDNNNNRTTRQNKEVIVTKIEKEEDMIFGSPYYCIHYKEDDGITNSLSDTSFLDLYYEEIPKDNLQQTKEVKVNKLDEALKKLYATENASSDIQGSVRLIIEYLRQANETPNPVDLEKKEVTKIENALDELKYLLAREDNYEFKGHVFFDGYKEHWEPLLDRLNEIKDAAQYLVNVLETEKSAMNLVKDTLDDGIKKMKDFNAKIDEKYPMSKSESKIDTKEEHVDPVNIWKDVNELPSRLDGAAVFYKRNGQTFIGEAHTFNRIAIYPDSNSDHLENKDIDKVFLVSDLINSFEQMQKDIEEFKKQQANETHNPVDLEKKEVNEVDKAYDKGWHDGFTDLILLKKY